MGNIGALEQFSITLSEEQKRELEKIWPSNTENKPTSVVFDCINEKLTYLHRGTDSLAFRLPGNESLRNLLKKTGPLIAPSANPEGLLPAYNIEKAKEYFKDSADICIDGGETLNQASRVIKLHKDCSISILRE